MLCSEINSISIAELLPNRNLHQLRAAILTVLRSLAISDKREGCIQQDQPATGPTIRRRFVSSPLRSHQHYQGAQLHIESGPPHLPSSSDDNDTRTKGQSFSLRLMRCRSTNALRMDERYRSIEGVERFLLGTFEDVLRKFPREDTGRRSIVDCQAGACASNGVRYDSQDNRLVDALALHQSSHLYPEYEVHFAG